MANIVNGTSTGAGGLITTGDSSDELQLQTAETTAITIDSSQKVGVGVTPSAWGSTYKAVQIGQAGILAGHGGVPAFTLASNAYENSGWKAITTNPAHRIDLSSDNNATIFYRAASATAGTALSWAESARFNSSGNLAFPNGQGIDFSASAGGGASSSILDDYEEGTWTPVFAAGTINGAGKAYTGTYTKIGRSVTVTFSATATDQNLEVVGYAQFTGLPFSVVNAGASTITTEDIDVFARQGFLQAADTSVFLSACGNAGGTNTLRGSVTYFAAT